MPPNASDRLFDKIADKIPYSDGGFRRRMSAGTIGTGGFIVWLAADTPLSDAIVHAFTADLPDSTKSIPDLLPAAGIAVAFFLVVYAIGALIEIFADSLVRRAIGNVASANHFVRSRMRVGRYRNGMTKFIASLWWVCVVLRVRIIAGLFGAIVGRSTRVSTELRAHLKPDTKQYMNAFPSAVIDGLHNPFGKNRDLPWRYFSSDGENENVKKLARRLEGRNKDVLVLVTALIIASVFALIASPAFLFDDSEIPNILISNSLLLAGILLIVSLSLIGRASNSYVQMVRHSFFTILEYKAISGKMESEGEGR